MERIGIRSEFSAKPHEFYDRLFSLCVFSVFLAGFGQSFKTVGKILDINGTVAQIEFPAQASRFSECLLRLIPSLPSKIEIPQIAVLSCQLFAIAVYICCR